MPLCLFSLFKIDVSIWIDIDTLEETAERNFAKVFFMPTTLLIKENISASYQK